MRYRSWALIAVLLAAIAVAAAVTTMAGAPRVEPDTTSAAAAPTDDVTDEREAPGSGAGTARGKVPGQASAASAAEMIQSGDGLKVENETGHLVVLAFPNGDTAHLDAGSSAVIHRACRATLPLRAEKPNGDLIDQRTGPCRQRATWTLRLP